MFNKDTLGDLTESILYVNLLLAILALIALYDQRILNDKDEKKRRLWEKGMEERLDGLLLKIKEVEGYLDMEHKNI